VPAQRAFDLIDGLDGPLAVGPCRCRSAHGGCDHPIETDIVIRAGVEAFSRAFPDEYRPIGKDEAKAIVADCSRQGMWQMVFVHCPLGEHRAHEQDHSPNEIPRTGARAGGWPGPGHEYVICNCCTCGCMPYILNREVGQRFYPLLRGDWVARTDAARCSGQGACVAACPFGARAVIGGQARLVDLCFGCGLCAAACPEGAIEMQARGEGV
jgi:ferredoxin